MSPPNATSASLSECLDHLDRLVEALAWADTSASVAVAAAEQTARIFGADAVLVTRIGPSGGLDLDDATSRPADWRPQARRAGLAEPEVVDRLRAGTGEPVAFDDGHLVAIPLGYRDQLLGALLVGREGEPRPPAVALLRTVAAQCGLAIERTRLFEAERAARDRHSFLAAASAALASAEGVTGAVERVADAAVPQLADWCRLHLDGEGRLRQVVARQADTTAALLVPPPSTSTLVVPLALPDRVIGALTLGRERGPAYAPEDVATAEELARRAALAIDRATTLELAQQAFVARDAAAEVADIQSERLMALLEQLPVGVVLVDAPSGRVRLHNAAVDRIWAEPFGPFESIADHGRLSARFPDGRRVGPEDWPIARAIRHGETVQGERVRVHWANGSRTTIEINAGPVRDRDGKVVAGVAVLTDVTDRVAAELALADSERQALRLAATLQASLLPPTLPEVPGLDVAATYQAGGEGVDVGGDFYDVIETAHDDEWHVVIGDVCGKGAEAAAVTALARYTLRAASLRARRPAVMLTILNEAMLRSGRDRPFLTAVYASVRHQPEQPSPYRVTLAVGGHPLPLVLRADGTVQSVGRTGSLVGLLDAVELEEDVVHLGRGDTLVLYTDGVTEARRRDVLFGDERLRTALRSCVGRGAHDVTTTLERAVLEFSGGRPRDDLALLVLQVRSG